MTAWNYPRAEEVKVKHILPKARLAVLVLRRNAFSGKGVNGVGGHGARDDGDRHRVRGGDISGEAGN